MGSQDWPGFPDFENPPVVEVALSVAFDPLPRVTTADLGALWALHYRQRGFNSTDDQPPVSIPPEQFEGPPTAPGVRVEMLTGPPLPRLWFRNEAGTQLIQVQGNWFARNWRKMDSGEAYP